MLCRVTKVCFWNGALHGPGTDRETVEYSGNSKEKPKYFEPIKVEKPTRQAKKDD